MGTPANRRPSPSRRVPSRAPVVIWAGRAPGKNISAARRSAERRRLWRLPLLPKHGEAADGVAKRTSHEHVGQEVGREGKPGKSDEGRRAIGSIGHPAMISVAPGDNGGDRECRYRV